MESRVRYCGNIKFGEGKPVSFEELMANAKESPEYDNEVDRDVAQELEKNAEEQKNNEKILGILQERFGKNKITKVEAFCFDRNIDSYLCAEVKIQHTLDDTDELREAVRSVVAEFLYNGGDIEEDTERGYYTSFSAQDGEWICTKSEEDSGKWKNI